jgi:hypothetical protein
VTGVDLDKKEEQPEDFPLLTPPAYCHYADGPCDQEFAHTRDGGSFFLYPSHPEGIATTIEGAVDVLKEKLPSERWLTWKGLKVGGQIIFCEICKQMRYSSAIFADVTTLNFNLLFEIGFSLGLGLPVVPIRDTTYSVDKQLFDDLGLLSTLGYLDFANRYALAEAVEQRLPAEGLPPLSVEMHRDSPLYIMKTPIETDGELQLLASIKKSGLRFRTYDPVENARLTLRELRRQVSSSVGVVTHLLSPQREGHVVHNAKCALAAGLAAAERKVVLMLQEGRVHHPIDYRDLVVEYTQSAQIPTLIEPALRRTFENLQDTQVTRRRKDESVLQSLDLGDLAAENEITTLDDYFVATGQYRQARRGNARLVVGRKGTGKTAIFYQVRNPLFKQRSRLVLDMKPEGHQFVKLRDIVSENMLPGLQEHTLVAFWNYILLAELARKILDDYPRAKNDPRTLEAWTTVEAAYKPHSVGIQADFSQRLMRVVDRIAEQAGSEEFESLGDRLTERIFTGDIRQLSDAVCDYLVEKDEVWLLIDNLDKGWAVHGSSEADIAIVRGLLEATRKIQHQLEDRDVPFHCLVFIRTDIHEHLVRETPDKGKDTAIRLDSEDRELFAEILRRRIEASSGREGTFLDLWPHIADAHIGGKDSFAYVVDRTLMRTRDLLQFMNRAVEVAINRGHEHITANDFVQAERGYSEDLLLTTAFEIQDTNPQYGDILYAFQGAGPAMSLDEVEDTLARCGVPSDEMDHAIELLIWFAFLGIRTTRAFTTEELYSYSVGFNVRRLLQQVKSGNARLVIHPGFRAALGVDETEHVGPVAG